MTKPTNSEVIVVREATQYESELDRGEGPGTLLTDDDWATALLVVEPGMVCAPHLLPMGTCYLLHGTPRQIAPDETFCKGFYSCRDTAGRVLRQMVYPGFTVTVTEPWAQLCSEPDDCDD